MITEVSGENKQYECYQSEDARNGLNCTRITQRTIA